MTIALPVRELDAVTADAQERLNDRNAAESRRINRERAAALRAKLVRQGQRSA